MLNMELRSTVESLFRRIQNGEITDLQALFKKIDGLGDFDRSYLFDLNNAIEGNNWNLLGRHFQNENFISNDGIFLIIAPYRVYRSKKLIEQLSGLLGIATLVDEQSENVSTYLKNLSPTNEDLTKIIGFRRLSSFGAVGGPLGEAFLVPNAWCFKGAENGPALNDLTEQYARINIASWCITQIFNETTSNMLLNPVLDPIDGISIRNREFQFHEAGHFSGYGFSKKFNQLFFQDHLNRAVEEWRSDGVSFYLMEKSINEEQFSKLIASNIVLRLGLDIHRPGGTDSDPDVIASSLMLQDMLESGNCIVEDNKLSFPIKNLSQLSNVVSRQKERAIELTIFERASTINEINSKYSEVSLKTETSKLVKKFVRAPCVGLHVLLR